MLWGLLAISIPVIIHLFNFRKFRKVYFTNVRFLEELRQQTRKQSKLRHLLVLIMRTLAVASLVMAFAQPYIPHDRKALSPDAINRINIYIDNSFSMEALSTSGPLLELAKARAREISEAYRNTDLFMLTTNEFSGKNRRWIAREEFLQMVDEVTVSPAVRSLSEVIRVQDDSYRDAPGQARAAYLISDFQASSSDFDQVRTDSTVIFRLVPLQAARPENLYIDSCWFVSPVHQLDQGVKLVVRVFNDSETNFEKVPLKFSVNGQQKALASFDVSRGTSIDVTLPFTNYEAGIQEGIVEISDYPVIFDDRMFLVYDVAGSIPVLSINGRAESPYLNSLYGLDSAFRFVNNPVKNIDYNSLQDYRMIILNEIGELSSGLEQELAVFLDNGGTLLILPAPGTDMSGLQPFLDSRASNFYSGFVKEETRVSDLDLVNPVFADVFERSQKGGQVLDNTDLPSVRGYYSITQLGRTSQMEVMSMLNGKPFLTRELSGKGHIFLLAVPLEEEFGNFARHALFVPALYRIALLSAASDPLYYTIGRDNRIDLGNRLLTGDEVLKVISADGEFEFIPAQQSMNRKLSLGIRDQIVNAGHYRLVRKGEIINAMGFNYNRRESVMDFTEAAQIDELLKRYTPGNFEILRDKGVPLSDTIKDMNQGTLLWKLFIILALVFLATEVALLRFWRSAT